MKGTAPRFAWMLVGAGTAAAAVRGAGLLKELAVASRFGTRDGLEAFLLALALPVLLAGALRSAILSSLVPRLAAAREGGGEAEAGRLLASSLARHALVDRQQRPARPPRRYAEPRPDVELHLARRPVSADRLWPQHHGRAGTHRGAHTLTTWGSWTQGENYGVEFAVSF